MDKKKHLKKFGSDSMNGSIFIGFTVKMTCFWPFFAFFRKWTPHEVSLFFLKIHYFTLSIPKICFYRHLKFFEIFDIEKIAFLGIMTPLLPHKSAKNFQNALIFTERIGYNLYIYNLSKYSTCFVQICSKVP